MRWDKLAGARSWIFALLGFIALTIAAFQIPDWYGVVIGWAVAGASLLLLAWLTPETETVRR